MIQLSWTANFIWSSAAEALRDLSVPGKYRHVTLPVPVLRHPDTVLKPARQAALEVASDGESPVVEYPPDPDLRDIQLLEERGIAAFMLREALPHAVDGWYVPDSVRTGYEISLTRHFYKPQPLRAVEEVRSDVLAVERETEALLDVIRSWVAQ
jgi:hypothetical protein